nr:hypothetical protein [uncultured Pseudomonas sp.]
MQHAISPVAADTARHLAAVDARESRHAEHDRRQDAVRDELDAGDWAYLEELVCNAPEAQRREFWTQALHHLAPKGADLMRGPLARLAAPLQEAIAIGIAERVDREIERDINLSQEQPWRDQE